MLGSLNTYMNMRSEARQVEIRYSCCSLAGCGVAMLHISSLLKVLFLGFISFTVKLWIFFFLESTFFPPMILKIDKTQTIAENFFSFSP